MTNFRRLVQLLIRITWTLHSETVPFLAKRKYTSKLKEVLISTIFVGEVI